MQLLLFVIYGTLMSFLSAEINIFCEISNTTASNKSYVVKVQIDNNEMQTVESSYIVHLYKKSSNESILNIDLYTNETFLFETLQCHQHHINSTYDVKLGEREAKDNNLSSVTPDDKLSTIVNNQNGTVPTGVMNMNDSSAVNDVSATTTVISTSTSNSTTKTTTTRILKTAEPSSTHSAQYGMGFGITLISLLYIGEIVYFKFFYRFNHGNDEYTV
ncbi:unnamed protein product [Adineta ricciae]|uniref:Uncharacterized protein n=1 Tax=Adineta ricciae TaxID=249248 RepID=A0A815VY63_ADIRI|nr:unnamed protein product [Adineta ricciae]CAF1538042.1 unnamed protein product [Adineta ricciae]